MLDLLEHKGYLGRVCFDAEAKLFHGEVINTRDVITFQGTEVHELEAAFKGSVDDYLAFCKARNAPPERPFSGRLNVRLGVKIHRAAYLAAQAKNMSLNQWIANAIKQEAQSESTG